ncbi:MAG: AbrB/MazE/SpoVT family DNA-binding domain-containing protein [Proteobacteria bacterium]|nr:AbrB/MazE/SpoVT family DNA-binding domain-containing protein [Pseudomonadota bacterium]
MNAVTLSPQFQVFIPQEVRDRVHLEAGQQVQVIAYNDRIELIPIQSPERMRGFLRGIDTSVPREDDRL